MSKVGTCETCGNPLNTGARFCSRACITVVRKPLKYIFTDAIDATICRVYREGVNKGQVKVLAKVLGMPRWRISRRAMEIGAYVPLKKEPIWNDKELSILQKNAHRHVSFISRRLKKAGYHRSEAGIILKRKRLRLASNLGGMSARQVADFFGVDVHWVIKHINDGLLYAERRGTARTVKQGGDYWFIKEYALRQFIIKNPGLIDVRRVEKFYFIELLVNGSVQSSAGRKKEAA